MDAQKTRIVSLIYKMNNNRGKMSHPHKHNVKLITIKNSAHKFAITRIRVLPAQKQKRKEERKNRVSYKYANNCSLHPFVHFKKKKKNHTTISISPYLIHLAKEQTQRLY